MAKRINYMLLHYFRKTQIGVVSRGGNSEEGFRGCANPTKPGIFMRVTHFKKWIQNKTNGAAMDSNC